MTKKLTKKQHYVPQFYLRNFTSDDNKLYLFLHSMIKYGKTEKDLPKTYDPFLTVEMPDESAVGVKTKQIEIIPEESIGVIKDVALSYEPDGTLNYRYGPALVFVLNTGLRFSGSIIRPMPFHYFTTL